ncbi:ABC2-1 family ABC transporter permease [Candidatus Mancarchaeum acidiphilum]|uniref:ABC2-1 family ABC transporter permease n=2 Tax=Candidatus Mancarchaeum acidiphilum TaxID=1920749 RepID=A0A218NP98_9ARCH|nr:ABC2-1 family ABC transporter permease [Candidatus Mancarchaeum acidiphilum]
MQFFKALTLMKKDLKETFSSISIYGPMLGIPIFFAIILPVMTFYITLYAAPTITSKLLPTTIKVSSSVLSSSIRSIKFMEFFSVNVLGPVFLTMPIFTASVIAADSFAGEKERGTSESLLSTPISKSELLSGKILASFVPTILLTLAIFGIYGAVTDYFSISVFHFAILPTIPWLLMLGTAPFLATASIGLVVLVSSHVKGVKEAQQISTLLVLPILVLPFASIIGLAVLNVEFLVSAIVILAILDAIIMYLGIKSFRKESILQ